MTLLTWLVVAGLVVVAGSVVAAPALPDGTDTTRKTIGAAVISVEITTLTGLVVAIAHLATRTNLLCPTDAQCSAPYSAPALVAAPILTVLTGVAIRAGVRRGWSLRLLVPVLVALTVGVVLLVLAGATYRIDVPRP
jgi:hypothetical protein